MLPRTCGLAEYILAGDLYPEKTPTEESFRPVRQQARTAIDEDGAEVIIAGCKIIGSMLTQHHGDDPSGFLQGVAVLDGIVVGFKVVELKMPDVTQETCIILRECDGTMKVYRKIRTGILTGRIPTAPEGDGYDNFGEPITPVNHEA